jgi:hypothetical protein
MSEYHSGSDKEEESNNYEKDVPEATSRLKRCKQGNQSFKE